MAPTTSPGEASSPSPPPPTTIASTAPVLAASSPSLLPPSKTNESGESRVLRRVDRKLSQRRHEEEASHSPALPAPLQDSDDDEEDADASPVPGPPLFMNMNQSIFGLIAAAGSKVNFHDRFDGSSSDEEDADGHRHDHHHADQAQRDDNLEDLSQTTILQPPQKQKQKAHRRMLSGGHKLLKSLPNLPKRKSKSKRESSKLSAPTDYHATQADGESSDLTEPLSPGPLSLSREGSRPLPVMSRMLEAKAEMASRPSFDLERLSGDFARGVEHSSSTPLARRLMEIFEFDEPEQVIEEYPCWLLQSVLLQGFMYITARHICFYAYLPKKSHLVAKSGYLSKSGKRNPKYNRYWFRLKGHVLSYYRDSTNLYFPHGHIDLSFGISASITDKDKEGVHFSVVTHQRTYNFRADSAPSATEWVKSLQRVIFRSHNDGDSVKISLPIDNVIDVEDTQMMEFADTCKIRVIDNDETYAIDEYFFSFFTFGREAINVLKILVEDSSSGARTVDKVLSGQQGQARDQPSEETSRNSLQVERARNTKIPEPVRATLSPRTSVEASRASFDAFRPFGRRSLDLSSAIRESSPRRSFSGSHQSTGRRRMDEQRAGQKHDSSDSYVQSSMEDPSFSNLVASSIEDASASQILRGSEVFQNPTMQRSLSANHSSELKRRANARSQVPSTQSPASSSRAATPGHAQDLASEHKLGQPSPTTPTLQSITKMGAYPLQRAGAFADYLNKTSKRMSSLLATESMGYVEKVSGMWKGGHKHYDDPTGLRADDDDLEEDSEGKVQTSMERFRAHFALPETEKLQATYFGYILRVLPLYGKIYISDKSFCFRSLLPGTRTKLILPLKDIETAHKEKGFRFGYSGLVVVIRGHEELFFEFNQAELRDDCAITLLQTLESMRYLKESGAPEQEEDEEEHSAALERDALKSARKEEFAEHEIQLPCPNPDPNTPTILLEDTEASFQTSKPASSMKITCLTIGSRGDVQPYIALCKGLIAEGHRPRIATHAEFQGWIESHGIEFARVEGDPGELMRLCIENGTFTWAFLREANATFRGWLDELLDSAYYACEGSDVLIESPSAMAGIHIAEKLGIPYFRAFTMPWTRTRAYPHAFIMPEHKMGGAYNYMTYVMFDNIFWKATAHQVNRWRNKTLGLPNTSLEKMQPNKVPFLYNFSPSVVAPPLDFSDWIRVTGYWFLDEGGRYEPPKDLEAFIKKARDDGKKIVYVGFGSIIVNDPAKMTQEVIDAVLKADVRCILSKGWSDRISPKEAPTKPRAEEPKMPPEIYVIKSAPHDWLFNQIDAAAHHGGSGTTGASLRAGIPTIIRPFFGDQFFFASRVEDMGTGIWVKKWGTNSFGRALWEATRNERMIVKARVLGEQIRKEKGVETAIQCIYRDFEYARSLIKIKAGKNAQQQNVDEAGEDGGNSAGAGTGGGAGGLDEDDEEPEESWTFVGGDEPDPDMVTKKLSDGLAGRGGLIGKDKALGSQVLKGQGLTQA